MSGNKPTVAFTSQFSKRAAALDRVAYCPYPHSSSTCKQVVWMVIDELLVGQTALENDDVRRYLDENAHDTEVTVFEGFTHKPAEDVAIWRLNRTPGVSANPDVAEAVWAMRSYLPFHIKGQVAPNHVLIPAPDFHACPWGSPADNGDEREIGAEEDGGPKITVIDSGYMRSGPIESESRLREVVTGEWFTADPQGDAGYTWAKEPDQTLKAPDNFDQDHDGKLDALAGHANFVAGVVAQGCRNAVIRVVSHDGAFIERTALADTPVPTEASVARSMWRAQGAREAENETDQPMPQADVINVGFAFPTLPSDDLSRNPVGDGPPSWTLQLVLDSTDTEKHVFVAPAGNQGCTTQHYPAAFPAVIGVGSSRYAEISVFSNRGACFGVDCAAGESRRRLDVHPRALRLFRRTRRFRPSIRSATFVLQADVVRDAPVHGRGRAGRPLPHARAGGAANGTVVASPTSLPQARPELSARVQCGVAGND